MKLIAKKTDKMPQLREKEIILINDRPYRILSKVVCRDDSGDSVDVIVQILEMEVTRFVVRQLHIEEMENIFDAGALKSCEEEICVVPALGPGDQAILNMRHDVIKDYTDSIYPDFRILQARGVEKDGLQRLAYLLKISPRQTRRLLLKFLQSGQSMYSLVDGRQTRLQRGYDPKAGAVRGVKFNGTPSTVLNDSVLFERFEEAYRYLNQILNEKQFQEGSRKRPTAKMAYKWMVRKYYSKFSDTGNRIPLPESEIPSYKRFARWLRTEKYGGGRIKDHTIGHMDWNNNRRLLVGDSHHGVNHPGELVMIDETELSFDLVTSDPSRPGQNVGGAIVHLCVDAATNVWLGATVSVQVNNSYEGVIGILETMLMDSTEKTKMLLDNAEGIENVRAFPDGIIPEHILVDHGAEYTSKAIKENLTGGEEYFHLEGIATDITLARVATGSDKGPVERPFSDFDRQLADAVGYGHGYRSDTPRSKHRIQAHVNIVELRKIVYEIIKSHNTTPMTTYPVTPELVSEVPNMTPLQIWDYLEAHFGIGITPDKTVRNLYRYSIMLRKKLRISRKQISYRNFLFWDIEGCRELYDIALKNKDKGQYLDVRFDPRTVSNIYYKDKKGIVYVLPLAQKRSNSRAFALYSWTAFDAWYAEYSKTRNSNQHKKEEERQKLFNNISAIIEDSAEHTGLQTVGISTSSGIREAGAIERIALTAYDTRKRDQIFGYEGFTIPEGIEEGNAYALPDTKAEDLSCKEDTQTVDFSDPASVARLYGLDPDDM